MTDARRLALTLSSGHLHPPAPEIDTLLHTLLTSPTPHTPQFSPGTLYYTAYRLGPTPLWELLTRPFNGRQGQEYNYNHGVGTVLNYAELGPMHVRARGTFEAEPGGE
eukprot:CAMPEP_0182465126 /NCGR_PEP_ID=MMETSP1319-20130603/9015_1 /TAXON_ID=172717 /ORGANISM="Bolidomonas pacifica, Strain RCC208" /LENGTH=107 /DNA_ID=CAMNT_0024664815 /DNA_START=235 /DNA_END=555 /DNA_ORIENTATION=-